MKRGQTEQARRGINLPTQAILLVMLTIVAYLPSLRGGFFWDDRILITDNANVKASDGLYRLWVATDSPDYWPMTSSAWWLEWRLWGDHPAGFHLVNIVLHAINALLVWAILRRLKVPGSWLAGCVFAVHPVNVATVAWISEQKNTLSMLFYAITILMYLRFDEDGEWRWYGASLGAFLLALLSKTAVVMAPVVVLGGLWWNRGRLRRQDFLRTLPFFVLSLVMGLVTIWYQHPDVAGGHAIATEGFPARLAVAGLTPWFYLGKTLLPVDLTAIYPKWDIDTSSWTSFVPGIALLGCLVWFWWKRQSWGRPLLFGGGYFVVTLFPMSGFFHQNYQMHSFVADHWLYHSIIGIIALVVAAGVTFCRREGRQRRSIGMVAAAGLLIVLGAATWQRAGVYADDEALWQDTLEKNPKAWGAQLNLGQALWRAGKIQDAISHYEQALQLKPDCTEAHLDLAGVLLGEGRPQEAADHCREVLRLMPDNLGARVDLGNALLQMGKMTEAVAEYEQVLRTKPDFAEAHSDLANALFRQGRLTEATEHWEQAVRLNPDYADAHQNLGMALLRAGRVAEAEAQWEQVVRLRPNYAEGHYKVGTCLTKLGKIREGLAQYAEALRLKPELVVAQNDLAWSLATHPEAEGGDPARAVTLAQGVCDRTGNHVAAYLDTLAAAYASAGRFDDAIGTAGKAIELARSNGQTQLASGMETRLKLYKTGHAYYQADQPSP